MRLTMNQADPAYDRARNLAVKSILVDGVDAGYATELEDGPDGFVRRAKTVEDFKADRFEIVRGRVEVIFDDDLHAFLTGP